MGLFRHLFPSTPKASRLPRSRSAAALGLLLCGCEFIAYTGVVPANEYTGSGLGVLTITYDGDSVWMKSKSNLRVFDAMTGSQTASLSLSGDWGLRAVAPSIESGYQDVAWTLHKNGVQRRYYADLSGYDTSRSAIPLTGATAADSRTYCDMDANLSGVHFIVTVDVVSGSATSYLYREASAGVWTRTAVTDLAGACGQVSTDSMSNGVAVLTDTEVVEFYADTLSAKVTTDLSAVSGNLKDLAHTGSHYIIVSKESGSTADSLVSVDRLSGEITDTVTLASARAVFVQAANSPDYRAWWTGQDFSPVHYRIGYWTIEAAAVN